MYISVDVDVQYGYYYPGVVQGVSISALGDRYWLDYWTLLHNTHTILYGSVIVASGGDILTGKRPICMIVHNIVIIRRKKIMLISTKSFIFDIYFFYIPQFRNNSKIK
jgi:hypothetical protein